MTKTLECEERVMLSKAQYETLLPLFKDVKPITLINEYFDVPEIAIIKSHKMLRVRNLNRKGFELTLKIKGTQGDLEINQPISSSTLYRLRHNLSFPKGEIKNALSASLDVKNIKSICKLKTIRYEKQIDNYLLVLDMNFYNNIEDFDLEIEAKSIDEAKTIIKKYCKDYSLQYSDNYIGKSRRAVLSVIKNF